MKQSSKRFLSIIFSLLLFAGALIVYINFVQPAYDDTEAIKGQVLSREQLLQDQQAAIKQVQTLINTYQGQAQIQDLVSAVVPANPNVPGILAQLSGLLVANNLSGQAFSISPVGGQNLNATTSVTIIKPIETMLVSFKFTGTYEDFKNFLKKLESNIRIFDVRTLNVQLAGKPNQDLYSYDITVGAYYQDQ